MAPKRKRAGTVGSNATAESNTNLPDQIATDASAEDTTQQTPQTLKKSRSHNDDQDQPNKRSRSENNTHDDEDEDQDLGVNGEAGTMKMEAPPKAGLIDPVGYKTNPPPEGRPVRIYADGVFDLFHMGHMRQLQQAKSAFPNVHLLVGVTGDKETHRRKGLTVLSGKERAETVRHCKWVDEVIEDCPWIVDVEFLEKHEIDYVAHDDIPYGADEGDDIYKPVKEKGMFLVTQRTEGVSTTGIITKIVRDYEQYIARQLKRGTTRQELNVSWLKKNELDIKRHVAELRDSIRTNWTATGQELGKDLRQFWQPSRPNSPARGLSTPDRLGYNLRQGASRGSNSDFAAGYTMGLLGSVRSWMQRNRRTLSDSRPDSPDSGEDSSDLLRSPADQGRGRPGKQVQDEVDAQVTHEMN
ncbi:hypothetical protein M436DRAFT_46270 [Aureobasidium namibiae CBS 147.97]|uniref:choline-phosphate cytidylyltransferase n=1 Tax=Aureobasidium namibiae CBS 147.97 TaxID=1043004 RepID=A0A074WPA4_9PEZI